MALSSQWLNISNAEFTTYQKMVEDYTVVNSIQKNNLLFLYSNAHALMIQLNIQEERRFYANQLTA